MFDFDYMKMSLLFLFGAVLTMAYYIEDALENRGVEVKDLPSIALLATVKAVIGGALIVTVYMALEELAFEFTVFGSKYKLSGGINVLISSIVCIWGSDFYRFSHSILKRKGDSIK